MLERRCALAGIDKIHAHQLRHTAADMWLAAGGATRAMRLFGWRSRQMLSRYGSQQRRRPSPAHARHSPVGDRFCIVPACRYRTTVRPMASGALS